MPSARPATALPSIPRGPASIDPGWEQPTFSLDERDRRWGLVRRLMAEQGIGCVVGSAASGIQARAHAEVKYLTQIGQNDEQAGVVFPAAGEPVVIGWPGRRPGDSWVQPAHGLDGGFTSPATWGRTIAGIVRDLGLHSGRIAVCGLEPGTMDRPTQMRQPEGYIPYTTMRTIEGLLLEAEFVDASVVIGPARRVKSDEEVEFIRHGTGLAELALEAMARTSRPGAFEPEVYAAMLAAEVAGGGTLPTMISWSSGPIGQPNGRLEQAVPRRLRGGDLVSVEIEGRWGGYNGQVDATMTVGDVPAWAGTAHDIAAASVLATIDAVRPGVTFGELRRVAAAVPHPDDYEVRLIMHGRGLGDDGPLVGLDGPIDDQVVDIGTVWSVKPAVMHRGAYCARVGESVVVRNDGAERLGRRSLEHRWHVD